MPSVIIFGPTGQVGSVAARTAAELGAKVWLAMRDTSKSIPGLTKESEAAGDFERVQADLEKPETVSQAIATSGAKRAFIYLVHHSSDHLRTTLTAMKTAGVDFVVFLSSFTIPTTQALREIPPSDLLPHVHAQVEANLDDVFGPDSYVAVRPGCFVTNILPELQRVSSSNEVTFYGPDFQQDNIVPSDIGRIVGHIVVSGPRNAQKKVYVYGPRIRSRHATFATIGAVLRRDDWSMKVLDRKGGLEHYIGLGMPQFFAEYIVSGLETEGTDKGRGERFPCFEEGVGNVLLYTGRPAMGLEDWVEENKALFAL